MKSLVNRRFVVAVLAIACLTAVLLVVAPIRSGSPGPGEYDVWLDWNDDGKIDMKDVSRVARAFGTNGTSSQNIMKASMQYDSGWIDLTSTTSPNYTLTHNLNLSSADMVVDARQRTQDWNKTYRVTSNDWFSDLLETADGGYALAGSTWTNHPTYYDFLLVKTDADGTMQWNKTYGGTGYQEAYALVQTVDGGYALAGYTDSFGAGGHDFWFVKTDASGNMQWNKTYGGTSHDEANALVQTTDGGYALAGFTSSFGADNSDFWLVKTDANGNMEWNQSYGGTNDDWAYALVQTTDGGYALAGWTYSDMTDFWLVKTDSAGNMQWNRIYGGGNGEEAYALVQTAEGGYALAGETYSTDSGEPDFWLVKTDAWGNAQWNKTYGGTGAEEARALVQTTDGGYALTGYSNSFTGNNDFYLVKTDVNGNVEWSKTNGLGDAYALVQTSDGGYAALASGGCCLLKIGVESGLAWTEPSYNSITLHRGETDIHWNYVRVCLWKPR